MSIELASLDIPIQVLGVPQASAQLAAVEQVGVKTGAALEGLSRRGIRMVETGFRALAFQAASVPGPLGRIAEGALLLGGGGGALLGVATAAGTLGLAWMALTHRTDDQTAALDRMAKAIDTTTQATRDMNAADQAFRKDSGLADFFSSMATHGTLLSATWEKLGSFFRDRATAITDTAKKFADKTALEEWNTAFAALTKENDRFLTLQAEATAQTKRINAEAAQQAKEFQAAVTKAITTEPVLARDNMADHRSSTQRVDDAVAEIAVDREMAAALRDVGLALNEVGDASKNLDPAFAEMLTRSQQFTDALQGILIGGITGIAAGIGAALAGEGNLTSVLLGALGTAFQQFGAALIAGSALIKLALISLSHLDPTGGLIAGAALIALGSFLSSKASQAFGGGTAVSYTTGGAGFTDTSVTRTVVPGASPGGRGATAMAAGLSPATPVNQFFTIIGPNDPTVQRQVKLAYEGAVRRGV